MKKLLNLALIALLVAPALSFGEEPKSPGEDKKEKKKCVTDQGARVAKQTGAGAACDPEGKNGKPKCPAKDDGVDKDK